MSNIKPLITPEKQQERKEIWMDAFDDVNLKTTNLKVAIECAYQNQYEDKDFDGWIMDKIKEDIISLDNILRDAHKKFDE